MMRQVFCRYCRHFEDCRIYKNVNEKTDSCQWPVVFYSPKEAR